MASARMSGINTYFKTSQGKPTKYATLNDVLDVAKGPLSVNGLSVTQLPAAEAGYLLLTTMLMHSSGEWLKATFKIKSKADTAQDMGGALTYARRYAYAAIIGVSCDEDDDGNSANGRIETPPATRPAPPMNKDLRPVEVYEGKEEQKKILMHIFSSLEITDPAVMGSLATKLKGVPMGELKTIIQDFIQE